MESVENNNDTINNSTAVVVDKQEIEVQELQQNSNVKENLVPNMDMPLDLSIKNEKKKKPIKRSRKKYDSIVPRRNPKRQTQLNKKNYMLNDDVAWVDEKSEIAKKGKANRKRARKPVRFSARVHGNCGAVYSPPSPISKKHMRNWPVEGMHERPEYNITTGKIEPLDYIIRSIAKNYNKKGNNEAGPSTNCSQSEDLTQVSKKEVQVDVMSHVVLHRVISYVASALQMRKLERESSEEQCKIQFLNYLGLVPIKKRVEWSNVGSGADGDSDDNKYHVRQLLKDAMIKYCISNNIDQSDLAKYIDSLTPEDIFNMSNEHHLFPDQP